MNSLDKYDIAILTALQADATLSIAALSEKVGLSSTPCWKRVRRLEEDGYLVARVSIINSEKTMSDFIWTQQLSLGVPAMDADHRKIINYMNALAQAA